MIGLTVVGGFLLKIQLYKLSASQVGKFYYPIYANVDRLRSSGQRKPERPPTTRTRPSERRRRPLATRPWPRPRPGRPRRSPTPRPTVTNGSGSSTRSTPSASKKPRPSSPVRCARRSTSTIGGWSRLPAQHEASIQQTRRKVQGPQGEDPDPSPVWPGTRWRSPGTRG